MSISKTFTIATILMLNLLDSAVCFAQGSAAVSGVFRQDGKIWVVTAVIAVIFAGLGLYINRLNQRVSKLVKDKKTNRS